MPPGDQAVDHPGRATRAEHQIGPADGLPHRYTLYSKGNPPRAIKTKETGIVIRPGDVLVLESGGGGGWGNPGERSLEAIAADRENGFVSASPPEEDS